MMSESGILSNSSSAVSGFASGDVKMVDLANADGDNGLANANNGNDSLAEHESERGSDRNEVE